MANAKIENATGFSSIYPAYVANMAGLLIELRRSFNGDLDKALIMSVIGDRHFVQRVSATSPTLETLGQTETEGRPSVNAYSISQYTDIPRETVRRKVADLIKDGWIVSDVKGHLSPTLKAANDLRDATQAALKFLASVNVVPSDVSR